MSDSTQDVAPAALVASMEARARRVETPCGSATMSWRIWGDGPPLVLLHGSKGSWLHWVRNIEALATRFRVIVPDLPGHGDSGMPASLDHEGLCAALEQGLGSILGDTAVDLVGFSFGGVVGGHLSAFHPERVRRLVLVGCGGLGTPPGDTKRLPLAGTTGQARWDAVRYNLLGLMLHNPESIDALAMHQQYADGPRGKLPDAANYVVPDKLAQILPRVRAPIDAIWGEFDRPHANPARQEQVLRQFRPNMDFRVIEDAGHWVMFERANAFNEALLELLAARVHPGNS